MSRLLQPVVFLQVVNRSEIKQGHHPTNVPCILDVCTDNRYTSDIQTYQMQLAIIEVLSTGYSQISYILIMKIIADVEEMSYFAASRCNVRTP